MTTLHILCHIVAPICLFGVIALYLGVYVPWHDKQPNNPYEGGCE